MTKNKETENKEKKEQESVTFTSLAGETKIPIRLKFTVEQLASLDKGDAVIVPYKTVKLSIQRATE